MTVRLARHNTPLTDRQRPCVVVVGAVNVDLVVDTDRLPGPGETVVGGSVQRFGGGKGANAAVAAARVGACVHLVAAVGDDDTGASALTELRDEGVEVAGVAIVPDTATGVALIVVSSGENQIAVGAGANMRLSAQHVRRELAQLLPSAGCVLVSTEIAPEAVTAAVEATSDAGVVCVVNPAPVIPAVVAVLDRGPALTPNAGELTDLCRALDPSVAAGHDRPGFVERAATLVAGITHAPVVVTLGGEGALLLEPGAQPVAVPSRPATVVDTTGAGDTFNGVLAFRLAAGDHLGQAVDVAVEAAALSVEAVGARTGMPDAAALLGREGR